MKQTKYQSKAKTKNTKNNKPIVCICASTRFEEKIKEYDEFIRSLGIECLSPNLSVPKEQVYDLLQIGFIYEHFEKIKKSDIVFILNPDGYIGTSVTVEIGYAKSLNKKIIFLNKTGKIEIDCLADVIINKHENKK